MISKKMQGKDALKLTARGKHAVMAMVELATTTRKDPIPLAEIAARGELSLSYLEQLFAGLRRRGLVKSYRGPGGGYILAKPPADIRIADIMHAAEDSAPARRKTGQKHDDHFQTGALWSRIGQVLHACLQAISLEDVLKERLSSHPQLVKLFDTLR